MKSAAYSYRSVRRITNHLPKNVVIQNENLIRHGGFVSNHFLEATQSHKTFPVINPANGKAMVHIPCMTESEVNHAIHVTSDAWQTWRKTTAYERSKILTKLSQLMHKNLDDLAKIVTLEAGKPLSEAKGEILYAVSFVEYYAEEAKRITGSTMQSPAHNKRVMTIKQGVGPVALITPWNFPSAMITRKLAPALAAGCTAILKPAGGRIPYLDICL
ncbi:aldehyde dehydrogenase family protein [archaeon]|nr:MAG: aldehyde dehydrogenase family protein [archaeon]